MGRGGVDDEVEPLYFHEGQYDETWKDGGDDDEEDEEDDVLGEDRPKDGTTVIPSEVEDLEEGRPSRLSARLKELMASKPRLSRRQRRKQQGQTAGAGWFHARSNAAVETDAKMLEKRNYFDPKRFYKKTDKVSKHAQLGTVIAGKFESRSNTLHKKDRRTSISAQLLADDSAKTYAKRKYNELQDAKRPRLNKKHRKIGSPGKRQRSS